MAFDATSVTSYDAACWWIIQKAPREEIEAFVNGESTPPLICEFACDVFWVNPNQMRKHLRKKLKEIET